MLVVWLVTRTLSPGFGVAWHKGHMGCLCDERTANVAANNPWRAQLMLGE